MEASLVDILPSLEQIRKELHQYPELSLHEDGTARRLIEYLKQYSTADVAFVAKTGVLAIFDSEVDGDSILLRADIDALPIQEINDFAHKSQSILVSHKCGHDGHAAIMLGVARMLSVYPIKKGKVILLFQPAEEIGMGAEAVLNDEQFKSLKFDYVFALHNIPGFKKNTILLKKNTFNANVKSMMIKLYGKTAHAAEPEKGLNPSIALADLLRYCNTMSNNTPDQDDFFLITPVHIKMGELAYGVSAGTGELHLTIRSWDLELFDQKCAELIRYIEDLCAIHQLTLDVSWTQVFYANKNNCEALDVVRRAAKANGFDTHELEQPFKWGEDFGLFTQKFKGAMFGLGAGEATPALHNPDYDFPDDITATGVLQFFNIIQQINMK